MSIKRIESATIEELINQLPLQESDYSYLSSLAAHAANLEILLKKARLSAYGSDERNEAGFIEGCGCRSCKAMVTRLESRLQEAIDKLEDERKRVVGEGYFDEDSNPSEKSI